MNNIKADKLIVIFSLFVSLIILTEWIRLDEVNETIFDPNEIWVLKDGNILVNDHALREAPIRKIDFEKDAVIKEIKEGRGPGEISGIFYKNFTKFSNGNVLLWDAGLNRSTVYNSELEYVADLKGEGIRSKFYHVELVNDSTVVTFSHGDHFLKAWRMSDDYRIKKNDLSTKW